jgi:type II restriction enzyme
MDLNFNQDLAIGYEKNLTQISRVLTEDWMEHNMFCPICGAPVLSHYEANRPLADFFCDKCNSEFELKSKMSKPKVFNRKIVSGEYNKTIERITSLQKPHLFLMTYANMAVDNLLLIPKYFFVPDIIEKRKPLPPTAKRAGWTGSYIKIQDIPESGKIFIIKDGQEADLSWVVAQSQRAMSLQTTNINSLGWMFDVLKCVERLPQDDFCLDDVYNFADELQSKHPENRYIHDKIRQQLQILRDKGFIHFISRGKYHRIR